MIDFQPFKKIARLSRDMIITEKIDGTNSVVYIGEDFTFLAGSRNRWINVGKESDNFGFAAWAHDHRDELIEGLGPGYHYGEWFGSGIQRRYGLNEKRWALFNVGRWNSENIPSCCTVVPVLFRGLFTTNNVDMVLQDLVEHGSYAVPGFNDPEGIVIFHEASGTLFKKTIKNDETPKGLQ